MEESSLKEKTAKGLFWGGISNGVQQVLGVLGRVQQRHAAVVESLFRYFFSPFALSLRLWTGGYAHDFYFDSRLVAGEWFYLGDNQSPGRNVE